MRCLPLRLFKIYGSATQFDYSFLVLVELK